MVQQSTVPPPDGIIVYIKPACYGDEPRDIYEYFKRSETFPHESTADQFSPSRSSKATNAWRGTMEKLCADCDSDFPSLINLIFGSRLADRSAEWLKDLIQLSPNASNAAGPV